MTGRRRWWHWHRPAVAWTIGEAFAYQGCRCGLQRVAWLDRGLPWWTSSWGTLGDVAQQLRAVAAEAPAGRAGGAR